MKTSRIVSSFASCLLAACAPHGVAPRAVPLAAPQLVAASTPTMPKLVEAVAAAERAGAGRAARVAEGVLFEGERIGAFVEVPEGECVLVLARGSATVADLDLVLWSDEGEWLAGDERRDADPSVILCPPHPTRVHAMGMVAAGRGAVSLAAQRVARGDEERVRAWLTALRPTAERGDERTRRTLVHANADAPVLVPLELEASSCAEVRAAGSGGTADPEVTLLDTDGAVRRKATSEGNDATMLRFCVAESFRGHLAVRARLGQGDVVVGVRKVPRTQWEREGMRVEALPDAAEGALPASLSFARDAEPAAVAGLVQRGLALVGSDAREVRVQRGVAGTPLVVTGLASATGGASGGASVVVVRTEARRFAVRAATADGVVRFSTTGVGEATFATPAAAQELALEVSGLEAGEPFVVLVAR